MVKFGDRDVGRDNNFNLLRMLAAIAVLVSHAWPLALGPTATEPLQTVTGYKLGSTAVTIFFAVSGYFITKSFVRRRSLADFTLARVARIFPALLVVLVLTVALLGPLTTELPLRRYFTDRHSWTYVPHNILLMHPQWGLPGVFTHNPGGPAVNGSLWTLFYEVACYAGVVTCGIAGMLRAPVAVLTVGAVATIALTVPQAETGDAIAMTAMLFLPFTLGAVAYVWRWWIPLSAWLVAVLVIGATILAWTLGLSSPLYRLCHAAALSYAALWFGFSLPWLRGYARLGDYSYGVYIYAFPVEQLATWLLPGGSPLRLITLAVPATLILAVLSWSLVEHPALRHRPLLRHRRRAGPMASPTDRPAGTA